MKIERRHWATAIGAYGALFAWLFSRPVLVDRGYVAEADLYESFLPVFLSPMTTWSSFEFGGAPAFADPGEATVYPLHFLSARIVVSWTAFIASAFVIAAIGTYAYVYAITRSRLAAACAGLAYALSETLTERISHVATLHTMAWLPLIVLAVDRLRGPDWRRWIPLGALALGNCFLAGQPQVFLYAAYAVALYALVGGIVERAPLRYYLAGLATLTVAAMLVAVKALPILEASTHTSRQTVNFGQFVSYANTPAQMLSIIIPAIVHEGREAPTYVGVITLLFAVVALRHLTRNWRIAFWAALGIVGFLLGLGDETPLARLAFELPFYDKFRIVGRHLFLGAFAAATLAGIGIAATQRREVSFRVIVLASGLLTAVVGASAAAVAVWPGQFQVGTSQEMPWALPVWDNTIWGQVAFAGFAIAAAVALFHGMRTRLTSAALVLVLGTDLISAVAYYVTPAGFALEVIPASAIRPSVHAARLQSTLAKTHQRLLSPAGTHVDAVAPAAFARLWQLPIAGGYGPMLLGRYADLAMMQRNGSVEPLMLAHHNVALDVMAVKFVAVPGSLADPGPVIERHGVSWTQDRVSLPVGPPECGQRQTRRAAYALPADVRVAEIAIAASLRCSEDVVQGSDVALMTVAGQEGTFTFPLRAGLEVSDEGLSDPALRSRARHDVATVFDETASAYSYVTRARLPIPLAGVRLEFTLAGTPGSMEIERLTAITQDGRSVPHGTFGAMIADQSRWRVVDAFSTSRITDRQADETSDREEPVVVLENVRALPRAWLVTEVLPITAQNGDIALHYSILPDGRPFDPATTALVDATTPAASYPAGRLHSRVTTIADSRISVDVSTEGGAFLVLSETAYPGWQASIGGTAAEIHRTNGALQGLHVPPGSHTVDFVFSSTTLKIGQALSVSGLGVIALLLVWSARRRAA